eukprot:s998_g4.t1
MSSKFTTVAVEEGSRETAAALLEASDAFLFDCDGTLYHAGEVLPNVAEAIAHLRRLGKSAGARDNVFFVTNTSSRSKEQLRDKLCGLGIDCQAEECVPSGVFAASYIRHSHPEAAESTLKPDCKPLSFSTMANGERLKLEAAQNRHPQELVAATDAGALQLANADVPTRGTSILRIKRPGFHKAADTAKKWQTMEDDWDPAMVRFFSRCYLGCLHEPFRA